MKSKHRTHSKRELDGKRILSVVLATVNGVNTVGPLALPIAAAARDLPRERYAAVEKYRTYLAGGAEVLDRVVFRVAHASSQTINWSVTVYGDTDHDTIVNGGMQYVGKGGISATATSTTINSGGRQYVGSGGTADNTTVNDGGTQKVSANGEANYTIITSGGTQNVSSSGTATSATINDGGLQFVSGDGEADNTTINSGGTQSISGTSASSGGSSSSEKIGMADNTMINNGGTQNVSAYAEADNTTINSGGTQNVSAHGEADFTTVTSGGTQNVSAYGVAGFTTVTSGGTQNVFADGLAGATTVTSGGILTISAGGSAIFATLNSGYVLRADTSATLDTNLMDGGIGSVGIAGGTATSITLNSGGSLTVLAGGSAVSTLINSGGTQTVSSSGTTTDTTIAGGTLNIESGAIVDGTTTLSSGLLALIGNTGGTYSINGLVASGGSIQLSYGTVIGRTLSIANLTGFTNFAINTNLASSLSDKITITSVTGSSANTVQVIYDPVYATGQSLTGSAVFATVPAGVTFAGKSSEWGAYTYTPTVSSDSTGTVWSITGLSTTGGGGSGSAPSETVRTGSTALASNLFGWRNETNNLLKRMGELRDTQGKGGFWLRTYTGEQTASNGDRNTRQQYSAIQGGYDKRIEQKDGVWYLGGTLGYRENRNTFNRGNGASSDISLGVYGSWLGKKGHSLDLIAKVGRFRSNFTSYLNNTNNTAVDGNYDNWGESLSAEYGYRKQLKKNWYIEPQAEISFSRMNGTSYTTSDGTNLNLGDMNSLVGRIGLAVGRKVGPTHYYGKISLAQEFSATSSLSASSGGLSPTTLDQDWRETWLEFALGVTKVLDKNTNGYLELTQTTGSKIRTPWQVNAGVRWSF
ncbi:MAG TPA: autotransporter outer membrane beta-barrel domain-containing protein [Negativicutes bacterium]|nr:autotransporter outer membrane beta-barrel domain-containing protein [Negativicutes bacterium]